MHAKFCLQEAHAVPVIGITAITVAKLYPLAGLSRLLRILQGPVLRNGYLVLTYSLKASAAGDSEVFLSLTI